MGSTIEGRKGKAMTGTVEVPARWVSEVLIALESATIIGKRSCNSDDHLNYGNHDRLVNEGREYT